MSFIAPVFIVVGDDESARAGDRETVANSPAFYASTPTYEPVLAHHGYGDAGAELRRLMSAGDMDGMAAVFTDEMLKPYTVTSTWDELADRLLDRYRGRADRIFGYQPAADWLRSPETTERWRVGGRVGALSLTPAACPPRPPPRGAPKEVGVARGQQCAPRWRT